MGKDVLHTENTLLENPVAGDILKGKTHILVIRLSAMGDVAMTVPVISALVAQYPSLKVTVLTRAFFEPIFKDLPRVTVYAADVKGRHKGVLGLYRLYRELKALKIDAVADLHNVLRSSILKVYFKLSSVPFVQVDKGRTEKRALTSPTNKVFKPLKTTFQRYADVLGQLGFPVALDKVAPQPQRPLANPTRDLIGDTGPFWVGLAPFAAFDGKMYPLDLMETLLASLNKDGRYRILLFGGGKREGDILERWGSTYGNSINLVGKLSFSEELAVISHLDLMLAMDSGNAHLASLFGIPTITLWGVTHPYAGFYPFGQAVENALLADRERYPLIPTSVYGKTYPVGYEGVMRTIGPESIQRKIEQILRP